MSLQLTSRRLARSIFSVLFLASISSGVTQAQVVPDGTLPTNVEQLENMQKIRGGERVGDNLFHSFEQFSIPAGMEAIFENAPDIQNIFTRITGSEISFIDGLLQTQGGANFFLINPNGIVFGENAVINVGGSFIATTANRIDFNDGTSFVVRDENQKPILTWDAPIGLGLDGNNGSITVNGKGNQIINDSTLAPIEFGQKPTGLSVNDGKTLALIGNGVNFNGGVVTTEGGNIYLTSVESGSVGINQEENGFTLVNDSVNNYQDINLNEQSLIDGSSSEVGNISVSGENINLSGGSFVFARNEGSLPGSLINIKANESINLSGASPDGEISSNIQSEVLNTGEGATINIFARKLTIQDDGRIQANTFNNGESGNLNFAVSNSIKVDNARISSFAFGRGNAGNIDLSTSHLRVTDGGTVTSSTIAGGNGGEITINSDLIEVIGNTNISRRNRANISASSFNSSQDQPGNAGNLNISTGQLRIKDGGSVSSSSFGTGNAGNISINASELLTVSGKDNNTSSRSPESRIRTAVEVSPFAEQEPFNLPKVPTGNAGNLNINTPVLNVGQQGTISVENQGIGEAGTLVINADTLNLDQTGRITAAAESGLGGNIELNTQNLNISNDSEITATAEGEGNGGNITITTTNLTAKKNNQITTSANEGEGGNITIKADDSLSLNERDSIAASSASADGGNIELNTDELRLINNSNISTSAEGIGNGGNITIDADTLVAVGDSDITATAVQGNGGNITITSGAILGIEERRATPGNGTSDIDASSEFGEDGTVTISDPQVFIQDPIIALREVPIEETTIKLINNLCKQRKELMSDQRHPDVPANPYNFTDHPEASPVEDFDKPREQKPASMKEIVENLVAQSENWQPGDPLLPANHVVTLDDGSSYLLPKAQWDYVKSRCNFNSELK